MLPLLFLDAAAVCCLVVMVSLLLLPLGVVCCCCCCCFSRCLSWCACPATDVMFAFILILLFAMVYLHISPWFLFMSLVMSFSSPVFVALDGFVIRWSTKPSESFRGCRLCARCRALRAWKEDLEIAPFGVVCPSRWVQKKNVLLFLFLLLLPLPWRGGGGDAAAAVP